MEPTTFLKQQALISWTLDYSVECTWIISWYYKSSAAVFHSKNSAFYIEQWTLERRVFTFEAPTALIVKHFRIEHLSRNYDQNIDLLFESINAIKFRVCLLIHLKEEMLPSNAVQPVARRANGGSTRALLRGDGADVLESLFGAPPNGWTIFINTQWTSSVGKCLHCILA